MKKIYVLFLSVQKNVDYLLSATITLVKDICAFNLEYKEELQKKNENDVAMFKGIETSLNTFQ